MLCKGLSCVAENANLRPPTPANRKFIHCRESALRGRAAVLIRRQLSRKGTTTTCNSLKRRQKQIAVLMPNVRAIAITGIERTRSGEKDMSKMLRNLWLDDGGQDVPEYALMLALILVIVITVVTQIGSYSNTIFTQVRDAMSTAAAAS
jgi:Flp pilus assembly pilin Flp